jgi:3-hydroxyisobutyrate dehydrogenase-like beta-hydroxyacid dehydrogenase
MKSVGDGKVQAPELDIVKAVRVLDFLLQGGVDATAHEIAERAGMPLKEVLSIMGHGEFVRRFTKLRREAAKTEFNAIVHNRMRDIVATDPSPSNAIQAAKVWAGILGEELSKKGASVAVSINFESIVRKAEESGHALDENTTLYPGFE